MKRIQPKTLDKTTRSRKQPRIDISPLCDDSLGKAMREACIRKGEPLSNQPLIVNALDSNCWLSKKVAYWPTNEAIGRHVHDKLVGEDGMHHDTDSDSSIHLILAFMLFDKYKKELCEFLGVSTLADLGVLRHIETYNGKNHVDASLLDVCEFRLDVQY